MASPEETKVTFPCPHCQATMRISPRLQGKRFKCPHCAEPFQAPQSASHIPSKDAAAPLQPALQNGLDQLPAKSKPSDSFEIGFNCSLCDSRMYARREQVGSEMECPDCHRVNLVPTPVAAPAEPQRSHSEMLAALDDGGLRIQMGDEQPPTSDGVPADDSIVVTCPLCDSRVLATVAQVGEVIACPDCTTPITVKTPKPKAPPTRPAALDDPHPEFALSETFERPKYKPLHDPHRLGKDGADAARDSTGGFITDGGSTTPPGETQSEESQPGVTRPQTAGALWKGVFSFPFHVTSLSALGTMSLGLTVVLTIGVSAFFLQGDVMLLAPPLMALMGIFGMIWLLYAASCGLRTVNATAAGIDAVENWPEGNFVEWAHHFLFVASAMGLAALPGFIFAGALYPISIFGLLSVPLTIVLLFPPIILSMLDEGSFFAPVSQEVVERLTKIPGSMAVFYFQSGVLASLSIVVMAVVFVAGFALSFVLAGFVYFIAAIILSAFLLIYFRLLGRLAWLTQHA